MTTHKGFVWAEGRSGWTARRGMLRITRQLKPELRFELLVNRPGRPESRTLHRSLAEAQLFAKILF